jgi:transcription-repair coupling factor (superfamily II helicase)
MKPLLYHLKNTPEFQSLHAFAQSDKTNLYLYDTTDEAALIAILSLWEERKRPIIAVLPNLFKAQQFYDRLSVALKGDDVFFFPQDEFITSELLVSSHEFKIERLHTIAEILTGRPIIVVTHVIGYAKPQMSLERWKSAKISLFSGIEIDPMVLAKKCTDIGYKREYTVEKPGDFSLRGGIFDVFPIGELEPIRLDFFGDTVEQIKAFEVDSQRSTRKIERVEVLPMYEFFYEPETIQPILTSIRAKIRTDIFGPKAIEKIESDLAALEQHSELDRLSRYLSLLFERPHTLVDFFRNPLVVFADYHRVVESERMVIEEATDWYLSMEDYLKVGFKPFIPLLEITKAQTIHIDVFHYEYRFAFDQELRLPGKTPTRYEGDFEYLFRDLTSNVRPKTFVLAMKSITTLTHMQEMLEDRKINVRVIDTLTPLEPGWIHLLADDRYFDFSLKAGDLTVVTEASIVRKQAPLKRGRYRSVVQNTKRLVSVNDLKPGDYVVHYDYGIGRFLEIVTKELGKTKNDYIHIEYRDGDKLFIPLDGIDQIQKHAGSEGFRPQLSKLGGTDWTKTKQRVRAKVKDIAEKLIALYAEREKTVGFAFRPDDSLQHDFEADFEYEETADQKKAIDDVKKDMETPRPMDRLLCGDVGFGKTEVAMRAAFKAVLSGKQVAYLAPTTVLAKQHANTFRRRMEKYGVNVALLNRFVAKKEQKQTIKDLAIGGVDVLIGTHRILSEDIKFKDLGLLVIDEEQRFGVEHKEKIKEMKVNVDVVSLSATPIPRTLQMAIMGVKNMSLLETAPENRYPVQTYVLERNDTIVKDAIERELARNGQVFYLYNRVDDIGNIEAYVKRLVPEARIQIAHGQMTKNQLENVIDDFIDQKVDVLVATTIVETGIDIPNANTLIIHDADRLGLSQLYQIRGRVGRSNRIAYAYLMYQKNKTLTEDAEKRLKVIKEFTELGSGFKIAVRDLSIRGAGDVLGSEQSGFIDSVGIDLYMKILQEEIAYQQGAPEKSAPIAKIKAQVSRYIDETYVEDDFIKLEMHGKINHVQTLVEAKELLEEFADRFGDYRADLELYLYEKVFEHHSALVDVEKLLEAKTNVSLFLSLEGSKRIAGDRLFRVGNETSNFIRFAYKEDRIHVILDTIRLHRHWLYTMVEFLERILP